MNGQPPYPLALCEDQTPRALIVAAANLLHIGEFQFLLTAFSHWHGHDLAQDKHNDLFRSFFLAKTTPPWALHYARQILSGRKEEKNPHRYDPAFLQRNVASPRNFLGICIAVTGVVLLTFSTAMLLSPKSGALSGFPPQVTAHDLSASRARAVFQQESLATAAGITSIAP